MLDTNISKYINSEGSVEEVGSGGGSIDADTLNGLLTGSNGISIAKNTAGDKVEVKIPDGITISNSLGSAQLIPQTISLFFNSESVGFMIDAVAGDIYKHAGTGQYDVYLRQGNVKTLFGNQSIYGSGNIDLYRHNINLTAKNGSDNVRVMITFVSSSNTTVDSLTDLYTETSKLGGAYPCQGFVRSSSATYQALWFDTDSSGGITYINLNDTLNHGALWSDMSDITVSDTVTTV